MAYSAVVSLTQTVIEHLLPSSQSETLHPNAEKNFISVLHYHLQSYVKMMRYLPSSKRRDATLERRVRDAAKKLEDPINSYMSDQFLSRPESSVDGSFHLELSQLKVTQEIRSFMTNGEYNGEDQQQSGSFAFDVVPSRIDHSVTKKKMVGLDKRLEKVKDWVLLGTSGLRMLVITGMAGIRKTTLVKEVYLDPGVVEQLESHLSLPIGPQYQLKQILLHTFNQLRGDSDEIHEDVYIDRLSDYIRQSLFGRKYLIVLMTYGVLWFGMS